MLRCRLFAILLLATLGVARGAEITHPKFGRDIRPILSENCFFCHGADANKRKAKLRLDIPEGPVERKVIVPGKPEESELITRIGSKDEEERMPPPDSKR